MVWVFSKKVEGISKCLFYFIRRGFALFIKQGRKFNAWLVFHLQFLYLGTQAHLLLTQM